MGNTIQIRVDKTLAEILESVRGEIAKDLKQKYGLAEITVPMTLTSRILAAKLSGQKTMKFRLNKTSMSRGILEIV